MRYFKYIFGLQLLIGSLWFLYYSVYWIGFILLLLASIILVPLLYSLLKKKMNSFESGCILSLVFLIGFGWFFISYFWTAVFPVNSAKKDLSAFTFERNLMSIVNPCFNAYDKTFSKSIQSKEEQCNLIYNAQKACNWGSQKIDKILIPATSNKEVFGLLTEAKSDAKNSLINWKNFYNMYSSQCSASPAPLNQADVKIQLFLAAKNKYLMEIKIKKAKS